MASRNMDEGSFDILQELVDTKHDDIWKGCILPFFDAEMCTTAAANGDLSLLKWLRQQGFHWDEDTCVAAVKDGHLELLKWVQEHGCPWNAMTCSKAALDGQVEILKWAHENGCPWDLRACVRNADRKKHLTIIQWIWDNASTDDWKILSGMYLLQKIVKLTLVKKYGVTTG